jgi:tetratricopeptide (TPR) repeat protein
MEAVLSPAEKASLEEIPTTNTEAYNYYLQGNFYWDNYFDSTGNAKAAEFYEKAGVLDPTFTQAFARAAVANSTVYFFYDHTPARHARITSALDRARSLSSEDPVVHWAEGHFFLLSDTVQGATDRVRMSSKELQKALKSRPNWADLHRNIGEVHLLEGALPEARESFRRFCSLDPMGLSVGWGPWTASSWLKEWDVARKEVDEYIARHPDDQLGYQRKADILIDGFGDLEGARKVLEDGMKLPPNQYRDRSDLITARNFWIVNYYQGKYQDALASLVELPGEYVSESWDRWMRKGQTYVALNQQSRAMACFDSAVSIAERLPTGFVLGFWWNLKQSCKGMALAWRGDHENAALELEKAGTLDLLWSQRKQIEEAQVQSAVLAGDTNRALDLIEQLIPQPGFLTVWKLRLDPLYNPLKNNPRFQALLAKAARMPSSQ